MKINWKDFLFMYPVGVLAYIALIIIATVLSFMELDVLQLVGVVPALLYLVPGVFYFNRNSQNLKDAFIISILFGFTFWLFLLLLYMALISISTSPSELTPGGTFLLPSISSMFLLGITFTLITFVPRLVDEVFAWFKKKKSKNI